MCPLMSSNGLRHHIVSRATSAAAAIVASASSTVLESTQRRREKALRPGQPERAVLELAREQGRAEEEPPEGRQDRQVARHREAGGELAAEVADDDLAPGARRPEAGKTRAPAAVVGGADRQRT